MNERELQDTYDASSMRGKDGQDRRKTRKGGKKVTNRRLCLVEVKTQ